METKISKLIEIESIKDRIRDKGLRSLHSRYCGNTLAMCLGVLAEVMKEGCDGDGFRILEFKTREETEEAILQYRDLIDKLGLKFLTVTRSNRTTIHLKYSPFYEEREFIELLVKGEK